MNSTFGSFEIGRRAIHAMQKGAQVTGQNIANANTVGYSRQMMHLKALVPAAVAGVETPPGYGVDVSAINRIKSEFYDQQIRQSLTARNYWGQLGEALTALEVIFLEPGETGLNTYLSEFFEAWQEISVNPESYAARVSLVEQAETLTGVVQGMYKRIEDLSHDLEKEIDDAIQEINEHAEEIANLNKKIVFFQGIGKVSNELLDERDLRLQQLSELIDIQVWQKTSGAVEVVAGGRVLLHDDLVFPLEKVTELNLETREREISIQNCFGFSLDNIQGGELLGLLDSFNGALVDGVYKEGLPYYRAALDDLVYNLVREVNRLHRAGFGLDESAGLNFFEWEGPMLGDIVIDEFTLNLGASEEDNITGVSFPGGAFEDEKLFQGDYSIATDEGYGGGSSVSALASYSCNGHNLVANVDVDTGNDLNSSILFEVTKLDGGDIYLRYSYIHAKEVAGKLETFTGQGIKKLEAEVGYTGLSFGTDIDWTLDLDLELEFSNFSVGDKFVIQVTAEGDGTADNIQLQSGAGTVYELTAADGTFDGKQTALTFFQLDETTGEHREVSLLLEVDTLEDEVPAASFTVGEFKPPYPREEIYQAAANFQVNPYLMENKDAVAAAGRPDAPGDGTNALEIARLREKLVGDLGESTFENFFRGLMADLGVQGREAQRLEFNMNAIYENMAEQAEAVTGVSLDDEMLSLVQYQHAYNAAAQVLSVIDEMLDTLINGIR